ncbi:2OG-Fe(II) oxygenase [Ferdinandcohnia quinoae]|uniref:2OG-Fe(II) oxygenase n=1 Tax=Fredinandcohnia quinoae TaxID=2918902 RepID=A0AAW5EC71_9BACI|nr:2OG-Fe(II) oxygenase [Fredinandcohnia sp. SECRCQ15]MCH1627056.1 2OG-Fe(II) oxygenase [Fredinandcohnia sp. SECRCQ15]
MEKTKQIPKELVNWIVQTLESGTSPEAIVDAMIRKGYDQRLSYTMLFQLIRNESIKMTGTYVYETPEIFKRGNKIHTSDCEINVLSKVENPVIIHLEHALSNDECDELIKMSEDRLEPSTVIDPKTGEVKLATGRTSYGMSYHLHENPLVTKIEKRIAELTNFPIKNGEGLQILNYKIGHEYKAHFDYFPSNKVDPNRGGQRVATFLMYLNDVEAGGETVFPKAGISIVPKKGSAVYFQYGNSQGQVDPMSLHSSIPVIKGEKWVATKWIRQGNIY